MSNTDPFSSNPIERIKRLALAALFSDDDLLERFVLKGGNALSLAYGLNVRVSADLDLSMATAFDPGELGDVCDRIFYRLCQAFKPEGLIPFDVSLVETPREVSDDLADFWGGYSLTFKLISKNQHELFRADLEAMRRNALETEPGQRKRFEVDISRYEHCEPKQAIEFDGLTVFVYSPVLLVCEKLRAICQQMPEYDAVVKRHRSRRTPRPRDFFDIHTLLEHFNDIDLDAQGTHDLLVRVFYAKRVPMNFLHLIHLSYDQHNSAWASVRDTVQPGYDRKDFDFYFKYVLAVVKRLHPVGDV